jgi:Fic family protein
MTISSHSPVYKHLVSRNLLRLKEFCDDCIDLLVRDKNNLDVNMILSMHNICMALLLDKTGEYRKDDVHITYSDHTPPSADKIASLLFNLVNDIKTHWNDVDQEFELASYALWRLNWIHPFEDGNGRISRALCYIILTSKLGRFESINTLPELIEQNQSEYQALLRHTDLIYADEGILNKEKIQPLADFVTEIYLLQYGYDLEEYDNDL